MTSRDKQCECESAGYFVNSVNFRLILVKMSSNDTQEDADAK